MNDPLSRVLLRWGDSQAYWWPFARWRPAKDSPLGLGFLLAHAASGLLWAGLPFALVLGGWRGEPSATDFLIPGAVGAIAAGTYSCLVRNAWNRRAALHRDILAGGGTPPAPQPPDATVFERGVVEPVLVIAVLGLALFVVSTVENLRGTAALRAFHEELRTRGAPVTVAEIIPPPIPDDRNLAFAPLLRPLSEYRREAPESPGNPRRVVWNDPDGFRRASELLPIEDSTRSMARFIADTRKSRRGEPAPTNAAPLNLEGDANDRRQHWLAGQSVDLALWQAYFRSLSWTPATPDTTATPARDVLTALARFDGQLRELREAAASRPDCRFPLAYEESFDMILSPLAVLKRYASFLRLRAIALLADQRTEEALADTLLALRMGDSLADQPVIISSLVRYSIERLTLQPVWEGCRDRRWTEPQLAALQAALHAPEPLEGMRKALDGERILAELFYDSLARGKVEGLSQFMPDSDETGLKTLIRLMPRGWVRQNQVHHGRYLRTLVDNLAAAPHHAALDDGDDQLLRMVKRDRFTILAAMLAPALSRSAEKAFEAEAIRRLARVGLALERHRLATGAYPETLEALAPRFLAQVPGDPMDGKTLRYARTGDGDFRLYSVGLDHLDDGGKRPDPNGKATSAAGKRPNSDLVWR